MNASSKRAPTKKAPASKAVLKAAPRKMSKASIERIDRLIDESRGSPGFEMVRALGELAKLGPYPGFKKLGIRR